MRSINRKVTVTEQIQVEKTAVSEEFTTIVEYKPSKLIQLTIQVRDSEGAVIYENACDISGMYYELLMSESPSFAQGKPLNEYREDDLWYIVDMIRSEQ